VVRHEVLPPRILLDNPDLLLEDIVVRRHAEKLVLESKENDGSALHTRSHSSCLIRAVGERESEKISTDLTCEKDLIGSLKQESAIGA